MPVREYDLRDSRIFLGGETSSPTLLNVLAKRYTPAELEAKTGTLPDTDRRASSGRLWSTATSRTRRY